MRQRKPLHQPVEDLRHLAVVLIVPDREADIRRSVAGDQVRDWRADHRRPEAARLPDRPAAHVAAVGVAVDRGPFRIDIRQRQRGIQRRHDVLPVPAAPSPMHPFAKSVP